MRHERSTIQPSGQLLCIENVQYKIKIIITASMAERLTRVPRVLEVKFRTGQILHSFANGSPPLQHLRR